MSVKARFKSLLLRCARKSYHQCMSLLRGRISEHQLQRIVRLGDRLKHRYLVMPTEMSTAQNSSVLPDWIVDEMQALSSIEPALYPRAELLAGYRHWQPPVDPYPAMLYREMFDDLVAWAPQIVFLAPHLMRGGADLGLLHHVRLCTQRGLRAVVVLTRDVSSPWVRLIPEQARVIEFGQLARRAGEEDRRLILLRLLLQTPARTIHLINSELGWQVVERFGKPLVALGKRIFASVYCDDRDRYGVRCSYSTDYLPRAWSALSGILSDNRTFLEEIHRRDGLPAERMHTLYFPCVLPEMRDPVVTGGRRVLWASRIVLQKRPEMLLEIAKAMPDVSFEVYGEADPSCSAKVLHGLATLPNLYMGGRFDSFAELAGGGSYDLFLYTSLYDGLPNVLLEASAAGLPIVAETVGGISELLDERSGYPLQPGAGALAYVEAIRAALGDSVEAAGRVENAQARIRDRHSWTAFERGVAALPGYLPVPTTTAATV
ncbi:glycosyltransferase family 4 protein [Pseudomonas sp. abacavir_1]